LPRLEQFRCSKVQASAKRFQQCLRREEVAQPEIDDLDVASLADENILNLQIPMHDTISVTVIQRAGDLASKLPGLLLLQPAMGDDVIEHLAAIDIFEEHIPMIIRSLHIAHAANERMIE
jgi:hypothetical protein